MPIFFRVIKTILYVIFFSYLIISVYFAIDLDALVIEHGIFTFFLFIKKWAIVGLILMFVLWVVENIHIQLLKKALKEYERSDKK